MAEGSADLEQIVRAFWEKVTGIEYVEGSVCKLEAPEMNPEGNANVTSLWERVKFEEGDSPEGFDDTQTSGRWWEE